MALLQKNRALQYPLWAEFTLNMTDTFVAVDGVTRAFGAAGAAALFEVIRLPANAVLVGGELVVETVSDETGTATVSVGDSGSATRYLGATNIKAAARTALVPTGYRGNGEDLRLTFANQNGNAAAGKVTIRAQYLITGRANETQTH